MRRMLAVLIIVTVVGSGTAGANELPVLDSGPDVSAPAGTEVVIMGSASDPDGDPLTISWILSVISGPPDISSCTFTGQTTTTPTLSCTAVGQYLVQISAFDGTDFLDDDGSVITFTTNLPPIVDSGPNKVGVAGTDVMLMGSASDPEGQPLTISWLLTLLPGPGDTNSCTFTAQSTTTPTLNCTAPGTYLAQIQAGDELTQTDDTGASVTFTEPVNLPPVIDSGPDRAGLVGTDVMLMGSASDPEGQPLTISWQLSVISGPPDISSCTFTGQSSTTPTLSCTAAGVYLAQIEAFDGVNFIDDLGASVTFTEPITDLTAPVCTTTPIFNGWIQRVDVRDPESGVASISVASHRRAWVFGAPITFDPPREATTFYIVGTGWRRAGRAVLDITNGDGTSGSCTIEVRGFRAVFG